MANVPIVLGIQPPTELVDLAPGKVLALTALPAWLEGVRRARAIRMTRHTRIDYADLRHIQEELAWFRRIAARADWTLVDVTRKAIEETAAEIVALLPE